MIGPYRVVSFIARGGMGDVYRATDARLGRDVALKVLAETKTADPQRVERFMHEARVTASLDHPNVVRVFDVGRFDDRAYLVAELLEGETLRHGSRAARCPIDEVLRIGIEIATRTRRGPRRRAGASRFEAGQHLPDAIRHDQDPRFRDREAGAGRNRSRRLLDADRRRARHGRLSGARADPGRRDRRARRSLRAGRRAVRDAHRRRAPSRASTSSRRCTPSFTTARRTCSRSARRRRLLRRHRERCSRNRPTRGSSRRAT